MVDEALSAVLIACVGRTHESLSTERVRAQLGEDALSLVPDARRVVADLNAAEPAPWRRGDITEVAAAARRFLHERHPELSQAAVSAVVNAYCFSWK
ncbi:hypothetical protein [Nocardioides lijunqiniae]|uniref:hypothetical protein n=1 Tax=Nocardioides lijunqiniae TaxID=2760832 RepID=UPI001877B9FF|nr:hypothetical protein [Nocardioides lijunqiniae]